MPPHLRPCPNDDPAFLALVAELDAFLAITDGDEHGFYDQFNGTEALDYAVVLEEAGSPVGCGALRRAKGIGETAGAARPGTFELKRMYVAEVARGRGLAVALLRHLEDEARRRGATRLILETGTRQRAAVRLYEREGYRRIPNYPPYDGMADSLCYERPL